MKAEKYNGENNTINQFIIEMTLINPVSDIVKKLKNNEFRDCDIAYLDRKLMDYTSFACKTLNINVALNNLDNKKDGVVINNYVSNMYISRFETILKYFETI
ncbi:MAG: hypothetical protein PHX09_04470 [Clostridia bacterium]|nr:hypothetical protein [Clostridia bacterium]